MSSGEVHAVVDLDAAGWGSLAFGAPLRVLAAGDPGEVAGVLRSAEREARAGRWVVGFLRYEAAAAFDPALRVRPGSGTLAWFGVHDAPLGCPSPGPGDARLEGLEPEMDRAEHATAVEAIRSAIAAGAVYQANLTFRLRGRLAGDPLALYRRLRAAQGTGQTAYVRAGSRAVVSASPELFLLRRGDRVTSRPMKGTAARGRFPAEDAAIRERLLQSEKDRAENVMIADLLRNDLGRVAVPGSVEAAPLFTPERFRTVWQLTSTVTARMRPGTDLADLLAATFPCGSVTGAPKVAAVALLTSRERSSRGAYCGAVGALAPGGDACFNVAIRTVELDLDTGEALYGTGGGITWDSDPAREWEEAIAKTRVLALEPELPTLLETMRLEGGRVALLDGHLDRLAGSAAHHGIPIDLPALRARVTAETGEARLRLLVQPDGASVLERAPLPAPTPEPVAVAIADEPVDRSDPSLFHKTTRRGPYERRRSRRPDTFDVLLVNREGEVTEGSFTSVVAELDGGRFTPPLEAGLLPGVFRASLLQRGEVRERTLLPLDLRGARRLWLVNALRGWIPARLVP